MDTHVKSFFKSLFSKRSEPKLSEIEPEPLHVSVIADEKGADFLRTQLELDIKGKSLGHRPIGYTLFELIELEALLNRSPASGKASVIYTHPECRKLATYVVKYYVLARDIEDFEKAVAYDRLLTSLLNYTTLINVMV
ncbi:hypothetical protein [Spirosoma sp.]|uniref:hypothetical protein n=1 Tax=Spirosoma sp. TaxID=1899569 RepID=UPI00262612D5|nr:hypothetical protein [Spirosoma sp.]MCX6216542.1 hypothetical protein [Spirosoma sp.]